MDSHGQELLRIDINIRDTWEVRGGEETVNMLLFDGYCDCGLFRGKILSGGVDTQKWDRTGKGVLSARYMLRGMDAEGQECTIFIENTAEAEEGKEIVTRPVIRTDSHSLRWMEHARLRGRLEAAGEKLAIIIERK